MSERLVLKPTPWFLFRAVAMLAMFGVFAGMFYKDGHHGYRDKNLVYYLSEAFKAARADFKKETYNSSPEAWKEHASKQTVPLPNDPKLLPDGTEIPMAWPAVLQDYNRMKGASGAEESKLFDEYRAEKGIDAAVPEHSYGTREIFEQWVIFVVCAVLALVTLVIFLRTLRRKIVVDDEALYPSNGGRVPLQDLVRMDLRKWEKKGLAYLWATQPGGGERKIRIDGFVYGGFKKENEGDEEPAETLLKRIRRNFQGEVLELVAAEESPAQGSPPEA